MSKKKCERAGISRGSRITRSVETRVILVKRGWCARRRCLLGCGACSRRPDEGATRILGLQRYRLRSRSTLLVKNADFAPRGVAKPWRRLLTLLRYDRATHQQVTPRTSYDIHPYAAGSHDSVFRTTPRTDDRIRHVSPPRRHDGRHAWEIAECDAADAMLTLLVKRENLVGREPVR